MSNLQWILMGAGGLLLLVLIFRTFFSRSAIFHYRGLALQQLSKLIPDESKGLDEIVLAAYREHRGNTIRWSAAYFGCTFGSALLSATSAVVLKIESFGNVGVKKDFAAVLAATAALLVTLSTAGDFHRKWLANRAAATAMENLAYDLLRSGLDRAAVIEKLKDINTRRNDEIARSAVDVRGEVGTEGRQ